MRAFIKARDAAAERGANQRTLPAVDDPADSRAGAGAAADDQRGLSPRPVRARGAMPRDVPGAIRDGTVSVTIRDVTVPAAARALDSRDSLATDERVAHDRVLSRSAGDDDRPRERVGAA